MGIYAVFEIAATEEGFFSALSLATALLVAASRYFFAASSTSDFVSLVK